MAIGNTRSENVINVLENVTVTIKESIKVTSSRQQSPALDTRHHGTVKLVDRNTGVFTNKEYFVNLIKDAGGPIDDQYFLIALSKKLSVHEEFKDYQIKFGHFVGFAYIQGLEGKFLGLLNERHCITHSQEETSGDLQAYHVQIKGICDVGNRFPENFYISLTLQSELYPRDLVMACMESPKLRSYLDCAIRQITNRQVAGMEVLETIEIGQVGRQVLCITYPNARYFQQRGKIFSGYMDEEEMRIWPSPDFL